MYSTILIDHSNEHAQRNSADRRSGHLLRIPIHDHLTGVLKQLQTHSQPVPLENLLYSENGKMSEIQDTEEVREAYEDVRSDATDTTWLVGIAKY